MELIKSFFILVFMIFIFNSCDETSTNGVDDYTTTQTEVSNCPNKLEIEKMINDKVEVYVADAIGSTINIAVANTLTDVFTNVAEYNKSGTRILHQSHILSDGAVIYNLYDSELNTECSMSKSDSGSYCCWPNSNVYYPWGCDSNNGCYVLFADRYDKNKLPLVKWSGAVDKDNKPCYDYQLNGKSNDECIDEVSELYCTTYESNNKLFAKKCYLDFELEDLLVCEK